MLMEIRPVAEEVVEEVRDYPVEELLFSEHDGLFNDECRQSILLMQLQGTPDGSGTFVGFAGITPQLLFQNSGIN